MNFLRSLSARILLGYVLVGSCFVTLLVMALLQFHALEAETRRQQEVVAFFDAARTARRMEKNFLLYAKHEYIEEAVEQSAVARDALISARNKDSDNIREEDIALTKRYGELLREMAATSLRYEYASQSLLTEAFETGGAVLQQGTRLNTAATQRVQLAFEQHHDNLLYAIYAALTLVVIAGVVVARSVVNPLREMENHLQRIAKGETGRVHTGDAGPEISSLARSINETIDELETRQESQARNARLVALGTMLSGVAHELNNPLANISSSSQILQEEWEQLPAGEVRRHLGGIEEQIVRAKRIVSLLLDFSGGRRLLRQREPLLDVVNEAVALVARERPACAACIDIAADISANIDRQRFQQVLVNLIRNALDAGGEAVVVTLRARSDEAGALQLDVEDNGPGIAADIQTRIFDPFFTTKPVHQGTGLGLAIAHEVVAQHGGTLTVSSTPGQGSRFCIHLPDNSA